MNALAQILSQIKACYTDSDLNAVLRGAFDPFGTANLTPDEMRQVGQAAKVQRFYYRQGSRDMAQDAQGMSVRDLLEGVFGFQPTEGTEITGQSVPGNVRKNGRRGPSRTLPAQNTILSVPSRSDEERFDRDRSDNYLPMAKGFRDQYVAPLLRGDFLNKRGILSPADELAEQYGAVPDHIAKQAVEQALRDGAESGQMPPDEIRMWARRAKLSGAVMKSITDSHPDVRASRAAGAGGSAETRAAVRQGRDARFSESQKPTVTAEEIARNLAAERVTSQVVYGPPLPPPTPPTGVNGSSSGSGDDPEKKRKQREDAAKRREELRKEREGRAELAAAMKAGYKSGSVSHEAYAEFLAQKAFDGSLTSAERRAATSELGSLEAGRVRSEGTQAQRAERKQKQDDAEAKKQAIANEPYNRLQAKRADIERALRNEYAGDGRHGQIGGARYQRDLNNRYNAEGVDMDGDGRQTGGRFDLWKASVLGGAVLTSVRSGSQVGNAVGALASGLSRGVTGSASLFTGIGNAILGQILAPFGQVGQVATKISSGLSSALLAGVQGLGGIATAGLKIGGALAGAVIGGAGAILAGGLGALIASAVPGVGSLAGAAAGAGLFAALGSAVSSLLTTLGGAVGTALGAIGDALAKVGSSIVGTVSSIQGALTDLTKTSSEYARATSFIRNNSGQSLSQSGVSASLAQILGGSPSSLNGYFSSWAHMRAYTSPFNSAFGSTGVDPNDATSFITKGYQGYNRLSSRFSGNSLDVQRRIYLNGLYGPASDDIGALFQAGGPTVAMATRLAKQNAPSPTQTVQSLQLGLQLNGITGQIDVIKRQFLTDLFPAIQFGLGQFTKYLNANQGRIFSSLARIGEFMFVRFPSLLEKGFEAALNFGIQFSTMLPKIFQGGLNLIAGFMASLQGLARDIAPKIAPFSASGAKALTGFADLNLADYGLAPKQSKADINKQIEDNRKQMASMRVSLDAGIDRQETVPEGTPGATKVTNIHGTSYVRTITHDQTQAQYDALAEKTLALIKTRNDPDVYKNMVLGVQNFSDNMGSSLLKVRQQYGKPGDLFGTESSRQSLYNGIIHAVHQGSETGVKSGISNNPSKVQVEIKASDKFVTDVSTQSGELFLRALEESG